MKYFFFIIILFLSSIYCYAQSGLPAELHFNRLTVRNGLPEGTVLSIIQGKEGYIWMSTQQGLVRYDGYNARVYTMGIKDPNRMSIWQCVPGPGKKALGGIVQFKFNIPLQSVPRSFYPMPH